MSKKPSDAEQRLQERVDEIFAIEEQANTRLEKLERLHKEWQKERKQLQESLESWRVLVAQDIRTDIDLQNQVKQQLESVSFFLKVLGYGSLALLFGYFWLQWASLFKAFFRLFCGLG